MDRIIDLAGNVAGVLGILVCLGSGLVRIGGGFYFGGVQLMPLFTAGIALMVMGCLAKLHVLTRMRR
ncbi:MAG: hypothetical protein PVF51_00395 [Nitrospirota bacterium]|jgi:hypothetical protein